jgi:hypothetical protein
MAGKTGFALFLKILRLFLPVLQFSIGFNPITFLYENIEINAAGSRVRAVAFFVYGMPGD